MAITLRHPSRRQFLRIGGASVAATLFERPALIQAQANANASVDVRFGKAPAVVRGGDGRFYLAYELHATARRGDRRLEGVRVFDGRDLLLSYGPDELDNRTMRPELPRANRYSRLIARDTTAVVSIWLGLPEGRRRPNTLRHELLAPSIVAPVGVEDVSVDTSAPLVLGPPFRQGLWLVHNGPGDHRASHWGSMLAHRRKITVPQRYAIDFMGLDGNGRAIRGPLEGSANSDWPGFGAEVIAVADGSVRDARDGLPDHPPLVEPPKPASVELRDTGGNYVNLELGRHRFVHYVHLQRGSVTVRAGQRVRRGQLLGRLGNSGNTNGAHLHFNLVDGLTFADADGLPYVFDGYQAHGTTSIDAAVSDSPVSPATPRDVRQSLPLNGSIIEFAGR